MFIPGSTRAAWKIRVIDVFYESHSHLIFSTIKGLLLFGTISKQFSGGVLPLFCGYRLRIFAEGIFMINIAYLISKSPPMSNFISLQEASKMTALYRKEMNQILAEPFKGHNILPSLEKSGSVEEQDILEHADKCPVYCPPDSPLNT